MSFRDDRHSVQLLQKPVFLPIICRLSIKDVEPNNLRRHRIQSLDVPSSPVVSCIGQVKRDSRTAVHAAAPPPPPNHHKGKSKKPRSGGAKGGAGGGISRSCRSSKEEMLVNNSRSRKFQACGKVVNIDELDPPLPVVKRAPPPPGVGRGEVNLWRRRCLRGAELESLQIGQKHLPNIKNFEPPPTV